MKKEILWWLQRNKAKATASGQKIDKVEATTVNDSELTLNELRAKYPDIKARSKAEFLKQL